MTTEQYHKHNEQIQKAQKSVRNALEALKTAALEPVNDLQAITYAGALSARTGEFINLCLSTVVDKLVVSDGEATSR